jgi:hypothetical protein
LEFLNLRLCGLRNIKTNTVHLAERHHSPQKSADNIHPCKMLDKLVDSWARMVPPNTGTWPDKYLSHGLCLRPWGTDSHNIPPSRIPFRKNDDLLA